MVPLPNISHCEITDWTVKTLAEQSPKDTGAVDAEIRSARQLTNFYLCVSSGHKYILQQAVAKIRLQHLEEDQQDKAPECKGKAEEKQ